MDMERKKDTTNKLLITFLVIAVVIILGLVGYICYDKGLIFGGTTNSEKKSLNNGNELRNNKTNNSSNGNTSTEKEKEENNTNTSNNVKRCTGTYSGETSGTYSNGVSYNYKYVYTLNSDGTYTFSNGSSGTTGIYVITDNTISFIGQKETTGPREDDPYYSTSDNIIADDCSYIRIISDTGNFNLNKQ